MARWLAVGFVRRGAVGIAFPPGRSGAVARARPHVPRPLFHDRHCALRYSAAVVDCLVGRRMGRAACRGAHAAPRCGVHRRRYPVRGRITDAGGVVRSRATEGSAGGGWLCAAGNARRAHRQRGMGAWHRHRPRTVRKIGGQLESMDLDHGLEGGGIRALYGPPGGRRATAPGSGSARRKERVARRPRLRRPTA